jgi:choline dehydrogenase
VYGVAVSSVWPKSTGSIMLRSADPTAPPRIEHNYLSDPDGDDTRVLLDGVELTRSIMAGAFNSGLLDEETRPGSTITTREQLSRYIEQSVGIYYHPACSCRMGPDSDGSAVVDSAGKLHGIDDLYVCDASIFPSLMRANTNLPAAMLAEHLSATVAIR